MIVREPSNPSPSFMNGDPPQSPDSSKFWFLIPIIFGLGLLIASAMGGIGLFSKHTALPPWLGQVIDTVGQPGNWTFWTLFIGGGFFGLATLGLSSYCICKKTVLQKMLDKLPPKQFTYFADDVDLYSFKSGKTEQNPNKKYYLYSKDKNGFLSKKENLTYDEFNLEILSLQSQHREARWGDLFKEVNRS